MRKLILFIIAILLVELAAAQTTKYVLISSDIAEEIKGGVTRRISPPTDRLNSNISFYLQAKLTTGQYATSFWHMNPKNNPSELDQGPIKTLPLSFLDEIQYEDMSNVTNLTKEQVRAKTDEWCKYDKLYFIDKVDFTDTTLKLIEVLPFQKRPSPF